MLQVEDLQSQGECWTTIDRGYLIQSFPRVIETVFSGCFQYGGLAYLSGSAQDPRLDRSEVDGGRREMGAGFPAPQRHGSVDCLLGSLVAGQACCHMLRQPSSFSLLT